MSLISDQFIDYCSDLITANLDTKYDLLRVIGFTSTVERDALALTFRRVSHTVIGDHIICRLVSQTDALLHVLILLPYGREAWSAIDYSQYYYRRLNGKRIMWHMNGNIEEKGHYKDDKRTGYWQYRFMEGQLAEEAHFKDDKITGLWKKYNEDGSIQAEYDEKINGHGLGWFYGFGYI